MTNSARAAQFAEPGQGLVFGQRVLVADGAMGTMLQASDVSLDDFDGHEGCNEVLNVTRPDVVSAVHQGYLAAGVDCVTTNTFGANLGNLGEYRLGAFFRARGTGQPDVVAFQLVTVGSAVSEATAALFAKDAYRDYLELHGLSVQLTEALAEYWHARVRAETGLAGDDPAGLDGILKVGYRGCRYSFGYPACPDLEDRAKVVQLLAPERIGVTLTEEFQLVPEQSTDALIAFHPEARYFSA